MSDSKKMTSAGRLATQTDRLRRLYLQNDQAAHKTLQDMLGPGPEKLGRGLASYARLLEEVRSDLTTLEIEDARKKKYQQAVSNVETIVSPSQFNISTHKVISQHLPELVLERLEALDELLIARGAFKTIERVRAETVVGDLENLITEIRASEQTEIDAFLEEQLGELHFVLENYALYGPAGVDKAIALIIGGGLIHAARLDKPQAALVVKRMQSVGRIAKGVLDAFVYTHAGFDALSWGADTVLALSDAMSGTSEGG